MANRGEFSEIMPFIGKAVGNRIVGQCDRFAARWVRSPASLSATMRVHGNLSRRKTISPHDALGSNLIVQTKDHTVRRVCCRWKTRASTNAGSATATVLPMKACITKAV